MANRAKKHPEIELPNVFIKAITDYYGIRQINKLSSEQKHSLMNIATNTAVMVNCAIEDETAIGQLAIAHDKDKS